MTRPFHFGLGWALGLGGVGLERSFMHVFVSGNVDPKFGDAWSNFGVAAAFVVYGTLMGLLGFVAPLLLVRRVMPRVRRAHAIVFGAIAGMSGWFLLGPSVDMP